MVFGSRGSFFPPRQVPSLSSFAAPFSSSTPSVDLAYYPPPEPDFFPGPDDGFSRAPAFFGIDDSFFVHAEKT